ncbi:MAG: DUF5103 domain-containing protein [Tannerellaceae bacterium]|nr:DUF5103 domain-containing protein [Tannerellaceae bacterium]
MKYLSPLFLLFAVSVPATAQETYRTDVYTNTVKTLQVKVAGKQISEPVIPLNGEEQVEVNFDALSHNYNRFAYSIIHCDADWKQSSLSPIEYLDGFQGLTIDDFANSIATTTEYTNYLLLLPNDDIRLKVSGNYAVRIYRENEPDKLLATACFSVVEPMVDITAAVTGNTLIDFNNQHQQVNFTIHHKRFPITYPLNDLKIYVSQNNRRDNMATNLKPTAILDGQLVYDNNRDLIFEAGNEYRRVEFLTHRYNGMGVEHIQYHEPYYNVTLTDNHLRSNRPYQYDQDQNGRFFIRCSNCNDPDTEADYYIVHFSLACSPFPDGEVYLDGDLCHHTLDEKSKMGYNFETSRYEKSLLLKAGNYNFHYLLLPHGETKAVTEAIEGNYYQAENEYTVWVYFRPVGTLYDRLIGATTIRNAMKIL